MATRILVFGAGAIGQWVGARLALAGQSVTVLVRPHHAAAIEKHGVLLKTPHGSHRVQSIAVATDVLELSRTASFDWVFVTVKAYDVEGAMRSIGPLVNGHVRLLLFQNGIGSEEPAVKTVGAARTFICSVTKALQVPEPGTVEEMNLKSGVALAGCDPAAALDDLRAVFARSEIPHVVVPSYHAVKWSKLLLNILGNAVCAVVDLSTAAVFGHPGLFNLEARAFRETVRVMQAQKLDFVALPGFPVPFLKTVMTALPEVILQPLMKRRMAEARGEKQPSLRLDMQKTPMRSEVQFLNGAVVQAGQRLGVKTPANAFITATLQGIVDGTVDWETYRKKPDALYQAFQAFRH